MIGKSKLYYLYNFEFRVHSFFTARYCEHVDPTRSLKLTVRTTKMFIMDVTFYDDLTLIYLLYYQLFNVFCWTISLRIHEISSLCSHIDHNKNPMSAIIKRQLVSKNKWKLTTCLLMKMNINENKYTHDCKEWIWIKRGELWPND